MSELIESTMPQVTSLFNKIQTLHSILCGINLLADRLGGSTVPGMYFVHTPVPVLWTPQCRCARYDFSRHVS